MRINTCINGLTARRHLGRATGDTADVLRQLGSGLRVSRAADDSAGLAVGIGLQADVRVLDQAVRNASDGISLLQTADGYLEAAGDLLIRMRELVMNHLNGTLDKGSLQHLQQEYSSLLEHFNDITAGARFNDTRLLDGTGGQVSVQVGTGTDSHDAVAIDLSRNIRMRPVNYRPGQPVLDWARGVTTEIDQVSAQVLQLRADWGAVHNRLEGVVRSLQQESANLAVAGSRILDADVAEAQARLIAGRVRQRAASVVLVKGKLSPQNVVRLLKPGILLSGMPSGLLFPPPR